MLRALPFQTIGDVARHGLELHVYCSRCFATWRLDLEVNTALHGRAIATTRFRCRHCGKQGGRRSTQYKMDGRYAPFGSLYKPIVISVI